MVRDISFQKFIYGNWTSLEIVHYTHDILFISNLWLFETSRECPGELMSLIETFQSPS